jgi:hypothetical protein
MGNVIGSGNNEEKKRGRNTTRDDKEDDPLCSLPYDVRLIAAGGELSEEEREAAGMYLFEVVQANRKYDLNPVLARDGVAAIEPPSRLSFTVPQLNVIHAICFWFWDACPPDNATIRMMGPVERRALWRFRSRKWAWKGGCSSLILKLLNCAASALSSRSKPWRSS